MMSPNESDQTFATISNRKFYRLLDRMDGFSIRNPEYKPTMLANKRSELYKKAEKMWNENRDLIFSEEENLSGKSDKFDQENKSLKVVLVSRNDEIKGLLELIDFVEYKNNLTISFDSFPDDEKFVSTDDFCKTARNILAKSNSNAVIKDKRNVKIPGTKSKFKANPARKNRADRNANAATENRVTCLNIDGIIETLSDERKDAAIEALKYFLSYMKTKNDCTVFIDCSRQKHLVFWNTTLKKLYEKMLIKAKVTE